MLRDEPWSDWTPVTIEMADGSPLHVGQWPGTDLCAGYPTIYDRPTLVAVTTPRAVSPDWKVEGWWADGGTAASLDGSVVQISPAGGTGITYLERVDQAPWPPGRYEFHVVTGVHVGLAHRVPDPAGLKKVSRGNRKPAAAVSGS